MAEEKKNSRLPTPPFPAGEMPKSMKYASDVTEEGHKESEQAPAKNVPIPPAPSPEPVEAESKSKPVAARAASEPTPAAAPAESPVAMPATSPPLFVKVDKYQNIINNIQKLKSYSLGLRDALDAMADIEKELQNGISILNRALDNFNSIIGLLDSKLLRIQGIEKTSVETPQEMDEYVKGVYDQMEKIRHDLRSIS